MNFVRSCLLRLLPAFFALPQAGCGGGAGAPTVAPRDFGDGTRLKISVWLTEDGFVEPRGNFHDSERDESCTFLRAADGRRRCMPAAMTFEREWFADPACTESLASNFTGSPAPYLAFRVDAGSCEGGPLLEYWEAGPEFDGAEGYAMSGAGCLPVALPVKQVLYRIGRILPPELFVAGEETVMAVPGGNGRLAEIHVRSDDGAFLKQGLFDAQDATRCAPHETRDGEIRCIPSGRYAVSASGPFGQPDCSGPRIANEASCPEGKAEMVTMTSADCSRHVQLFSPGALWQGSQTFSASDTGCVAAPAVTTTLVEVGAELDPARFVGLTIEHAGTRRLRSTRYLDGKGASLPESIYDSLLETSCTFSLAPDGRSRCTPPMLSTAFLDATCTEAVAVAFYSEPCEPASGKKYLMVNGSLHERGAKLSEPPVEIFALASPGACVVAPYMLSTGFSYFAAGPEVPVELVAASTLP
jgi:hypothetical protein